VFRPFPIVAFVEKLGAKPRKVASLYLGRNVGAKLLYAGKARSGYTQEIARELAEFRWWRPLGQRLTNDTRE
jgi:bifunctional non-homologous end joining protein LigD